MILFVSFGGKISETIHLNENTNKIQVVGKLRQEIIDLLGITLVAGDILMYPHACKSAKKTEKWTLDCSSQK